MSGDLEGERDMREAVELLLDSGQPGIAADSLWNLGACLRLWIGTAAAPIAMRLSNYVEIEALAALTVCSSCVCSLLRRRPLG